MKIKIFDPNAKIKFQEWIDTRGGIQIWDNVDLSNLDAGQMFTPALTSEGTEYPSPRWSHRRGEIVKDLSRFAFVQLKEVKRIKIAVRRGAQGVYLKLTDASSRKLDQVCEQVKEQFKEEPVYHFEYDEAVISIPYSE